MRARRAIGDAAPAWLTGSKAKVPRPRQSCYKVMMRWPWPPLRFGDLLGIALLFAILGMFAILMIGYPNVFQQNTNAGFGPDWECTQTGDSGPVCVKRTNKAAR